MTDIDFSAPMWQVAVGEPSTSAIQLGRSNAPGTAMKKREPLRCKHNAELWTWHGTLYTCSIIFLGFMSLVSIHKLYMSPKIILFSHESSPKSCFGGRILTVFLDAAINHQPAMILGIARIKKCGWWWCLKSWQIIIYHHHYHHYHHYDRDNKLMMTAYKSIIIIILYAVK